MSKIELTDAEIASLLSEEKVLPLRYHRTFKLRARRGHSEAQMEIVTPDQHRFRFILRQSAFNLLDFSAVLGYTLTSGRLFLLKRYNGKSHEHTNDIEGETFYDFHIHTATERYQARGANEERYAEVTSRYATLRQAFDCLIADCDVKFEEDNLGQTRLFR